MTFWIIYLTNVFIINPKLDVWYFICSTSLISFKLFATFRLTNRKNPGILEKDSDVKYTDEVLKNVP